MIKPMNTQSDHIQLPEELFKHFRSCVDESQLEATLVDGVTKQPLRPKTQIFVYLEHFPAHKPTGRGIVEVVFAERLVLSDFRTSSDNRPSYAIPHQRQPS